MALTIADVLALDPFIEAEAEVVSGTDTLGRHVRWVHSSEIYEMAPLLSGDSSRLPVPTQAPRLTDAAVGTASVTTSRPDPSRDLSMTPPTAGRRRRRLVPPAVGRRPPIP